MDPMHALDLERSVVNPRTLQGPFTVVIYKDEFDAVQVRILDGQHRQEVLRRYFAAHADAEDFQVLVRRYSIHSHEEAVAIFQQINHAKPMVYRGSDTERLHEIVTALKRHFVGERPDGTMVGFVRPAANRPFLNTEALETALKLYGIHEREDITPDEVVAYADKMNAWFTEDPVRTNARVTRTTLDRAIAYQFFLGLDPKCQWLVGLKK